MEIRVEENGERIDKFLVPYLDYSRSQIAKLIDENIILVNSQPTKANYQVRKDDIISISEVESKNDDIIPENIPLDIIYEDDDIMVINKKSGMVVHPGNGNTHSTLVNALVNYTNNLSDINGEIRPGIVHRIDKDTSGIMLVAKTNKAHQILSDALSRHEINREYIALVKGEFPSDTATIDAPIGRDKYNRKRMAVTSINSKKAITHLRVIERFKGFTLIRLQLETGRTHQIRVHMAYTGYPIYNDPVYTNDSCTEFGQFLHSASIDFKHPITNEVLHFEAPLPHEFEEFLGGLEKV